jgi:DNA repair protein RadD
MIPRPYQSKAISDLWDWFEKHPEGNPVIEACVGAGKSYVIAALCQHAITTWKGTRILMLVHVKELIEQNHEELLKVWPEAPVGIHSASVGKKDIGNDILYCGIGSVYKKAHLMGKIDLVLVDECHLINTENSGMYRTFLNELKRYCPFMRTIGLTGTAFRGNGVWLTDGDNPLFTHVAARVTMKELLKLGFLAKLKPAVTGVHYSSDGIEIVNGDYNIRQLADRVDRDELINATCDDMIVKASQRKKWLVFCVNVEHAIHVSDALKRRGIASAVIHGETPKSEREKTIARFRAGELQAICNCAVLTTGFNVKDVDCIALLRSTKSPVLYVQIAGRGMRTADGKEDCLWLDYTDTTERLGPVDAIAGHAKRKARDKTAPSKICEECGNPNPISAKECIECGHPFDIVEKDPHGTTTSTAAVMSADVKPVRYRVDRVSYAKHQKSGKPPSLRVEYWCGYRIVAKEWIALESANQWGRASAATWWQKRTGHAMAPKNIDQALIYIKDCGITEPGHIEVNESKAYPEIVKYYRKEVTA